MKRRHEILTIAGFDPSGGAGILADIKTFEQHKCLGFAVQTANTIQSEVEFVKPGWMVEEDIFEQLELILKTHRFDYAKIGLIPNMDFMERLLSLDSLEKTKFIWDPILSTSTGFDFKHDLNELKGILKKVWMVTPNWNEMVMLSGNNDPKEGAKELAEFTKIYLKGGHNNAAIGKDFLFEKDKVQAFNPKQDKCYEKHGSGCVFSAALAANLARGYHLNRSILYAKRYVEKYLASTDQLLGYHK